MLKNIIVAITLILSACNQELQPPTSPDAGARTANPNVNYSWPTCDVPTELVVTCKNNAVCNNPDTGEKRVGCVLQLTSDTNLWFNCVDSCD